MIKQIYIGKYCEKCDKMGFRKCYCQNTHDYPYAQCETTAVGIKQAESAAELEAAKKAIVNLYRDENTGEIVTICQECFTSNDAEMKDMTYIDLAADWDICQCCEAQNIPVGYHGDNQ